MLSAMPGCRLGHVTIILNDTYIDVGQQHIFKVKKYEDNPTLNKGTVSQDGTTVEGTFANSRILVEWWGAKGGRGVNRGSFENKATEDQALENAYAFNNALRCAGGSEVYAPAPMYMIGGTIADTSYPTLTDEVPKDGRNAITSYTKLYVEGDLVASNEFIGYQRKSAYTKLEGIQYNGNSCWTTV